jgi:UDP-glucose 4-epimerase
MARIVVTGAAGYVGSVFTCRAVELGHDVVAIDNLDRGLNEIWNVKGAQFVKHDCQGGFAEALPGRVDGYESKTFSVDAVVHFAAGTGSLDRPIKELRALNVEMTKRVYWDALATGAKVFCFPTTSLALGVPDSPYVQSKEEGFRWLKAQKDTGIFKMPLRFFNVAGAYKGFTERRKNEVHLIPNMVECYRTGEPLVINGNDYDTIDGTPSRDFVNVLDVVECILYRMTNILAAGGMTNILAAGDIKTSLNTYSSDGALWIGTGHTTTALQAVKIFEQFVGPLKYEYGPRRAFDTGALRCPDYANALRIGDLRQRRPPAPSWGSIRDEAEALLGSAA